MRIFSLRFYRCIYLVAELSKLQTTQEQMKVLIPLMAETTKHRHYSQYLQLYESLCKQVGGKLVFKPLLNRDTLYPWLFTRMIGQCA